jgi:hypothetical protein
MHPPDAAQFPDASIWLIEERRGVFTERLEAMEPRLVSTLDEPPIEEHVVAARSPTRRRRADLPVI